MNRESLRLLTDFRNNAETLYKTGKVQQQDLLQAEVEIGQQRQRQLTLTRMRSWLRPASIPYCIYPPKAPCRRRRGKFRRAASCRTRRCCAASPWPARPDLQAMADHIAAERAALCLAHKEYYPDFEAMAAYDEFWNERQGLRPQLAVRMNLPVPLGKARCGGARGRSETRRAHRGTQSTDGRSELHGGSSVP